MGAESEIVVFGAARVLAKTSATFTPETGAVYDVTIPTTEYVDFAYGSDARLDVRAKPDDGGDGESQQIVVREYTAEDNGTEEDEINSISGGASPIELTPDIEWEIEATLQTEFKGGTPCIKDIVTQGQPDFEATDVQDLCPQEIGLDFGEIRLVACA